MCAPRQTQREDFAYYFERGVRHCCRRVITLRWFPSIIFSLAKPREGKELAAAVATAAALGGGPRRAFSLSAWLVEPPGSRRAAFGRSRTTLFFHGSSRERPAWATQRPGGRLRKRNNASLSHRNAAGGRMMWRGLRAGAMCLWHFWKHVSFDVKKINTRAPSSTSKMIIFCSVLVRSEQNSYQRAQASVNLLIIFYTICFRSLQFFK